MRYPCQRWFDTAPPALAQRVTAIAEDGVLPPWDAWFGRRAIAELLPDPELRAGFSADLPRVPLAYLEAIAPSGGVWRDLPAGYLQLSDACASEADEAEAQGWPVRREILHHLAMLTHPDRLAAILAEMALELTRA